ncbi:MAG: DUF374 domain-containing protein [Rickettsiales bacterium]|jgi:lysophospholipid acyltransferase (LPLAT)-like uncharacterized protein|nr:DUF374 domain-containing protein [Rickettsiales bacterium]
MKTFRKIWKGFWEPLLRLPIVQWLVAALMCAVIWLVFFTSWHTTDGRKVFREYRRKSAVFVFWHGRSMMLSPIVRTYGIRGYAVSSRSKDGRMMAKLQRLFGLRPIYGSTSEGGISVLRQGVRVLRDGRHIVAISPDGPSGPSLRIQDGALYFAKMSGVPIIPVCYSCSRPWFQKRWDRYLIAAPFSRIVCKVGKPVFIGAKDDMDAARAKLEAIMVKQMRGLDAQFTKFKVEQDLNAQEFKQKMREAKKK